MKKLIPIFVLLVSCSKKDLDTVVIKSNQLTTTTTNIVDPFKSYQVDINQLNKSKQKDFGKSYWQNTGVMNDTIVGNYQKGLQPGMNGIYYFTGFTTGLASGDFNNDGWIDVFNPGSTTSGGVYSHLSFLIWDTKTKTFIDSNLFNDKSFKYIGANQIKTIPLYLNDDNYVDLVLIDNSEGFTFPTSQPVRIALSDGKGGYDLKEIRTEEVVSQYLTHPGGDIDDLNNDGIPDLVLPYGFALKIFWGTKSFPYFDYKNATTFYTTGNGPYYIWGYLKDDVGCPSCVEHELYTVNIADLNNDGNKDIILGEPESSDDPKNIKYSRILFNKGEGKFNNSSVLKLPKYDSTSSELYFNLDYVVDDINKDGRMDIIALNNHNNIFVYKQQENGTFVIMKNDLKLKSKPCSLIYHDFNGDGIKDISTTEISANQSMTKNIFYFNNFSLY